jgi:hypothetical protein
MSRLPQTIHLPHRGNLRVGGNIPLYPLWPSNNRLNHHFPAGQAPAQKPKGN